MARARPGIGDNLRIFGRTKRFEAALVPIKALDLDFYTRPEDFFLKADEKRRKRASPGRFRKRVVSLGSAPRSVTSAEAKADELAWNKDKIYTDSKLRVFIAHDAVDLAKQRGETHTIAYRALDELTDEERMAIILRRLAKSTDFPTMARIEAIRESIDVLGWSFNTVRDLMVVRGKAKLSLSDIVNEYRTAKIYEEFCNHRTPTSEHSLADHPDTFSKIKFLVGTKDIRESMENDKSVREYFVNMAIGTTVTGEERFQDNVPKILKNPRTRKTFLEERGGYSKSVAELKAIHPEVDRKTFPHYDYVAGYEKIRNPDNQKVIKGQIERNPEGNPTLNVFAASMAILAALAPAAFQKFARTLAEVNKDGLVRFVVRGYTTEVMDELGRVRTQIRRIK